MGLKENGEVGRRTLEINDGAQCLAHSNCSKNDMLESAIMILFTILQMRRISLREVQ